LQDAVAARAKYDLTHSKNDLSSADSSLAFANEQRSLYAAAYSSRGHAYVVKGSGQLAIADFTKLIELESSQAVHYRDRAKAYRSMKQLRLAIADERRAAELEKQ
jgi:tetratricopeptide (TPR) repeat protein